MTKKVDYKKKTIKDLQEVIASAYKTLGNARFSAASSRSTNTKEGKEAKKEIARAKTELRSRELAQDNK
jgi:ribosomal protein L29